jgi:hypothetical protein
MDSPVVLRQIFGGTRQRSDHMAGTVHLGCTLRRSCMPMPLGVHSPRKDRPAMFDSLEVSSNCDNVDGEAQCRETQPSLHVFSDVSDHCSYSALSVLHLRWWVWVCTCGPCRSVQSAQIVATSRAHESPDSVEMHRLSWVV